VPCAESILGVALATNTASVNSQATYWKGEYFRKELSVDNTIAAVWNSITISALGETDVNSNVFAFKTADSFG